MGKKIIAIILELIPLVAAISSYFLIRSSKDQAFNRRTIIITLLLAFLGIPFYFIGRKIAGEEKIVRLFGAVDLLVSVFVIGLYGIALLSYGL